MQLEVIDKITIITLVYKYYSIGAACWILLVQKNNLYEGYEVIPGICNA